jgi:pilus assembly protein TadC
MELKTTHFIGIGIGFFLLGISFFLTTGSVQIFLTGIGLLIMILPFVFELIQETKNQTEKEEMFLEFARNLVESVKAGTPISKSITQIRGKSYGALNPHVNKLANQISLGIPLNTALQIFAKDIDNKTISRAITLIGEAERAGGDIGEILESVTSAVNMSDKLKKERKAAVSTLVVQGYIVFAVFIIIIMVMQFQILPMLSGVANVGDVGIEGFGGGGSIDPVEIANAFLYLLLAQGFFSGLTIGKLAEGNIKYGVKHSFILMVASFLVSTGANIILG